MSTKTLQATGSASKVAASWLRDNLSEVVSRVAYGGERFIVNRRNKEGVALVSILDFELLEALEDKIDLKDALEALRLVESEGTISFDEMERRLGLAK